MGPVPLTLVRTLVGTIAAAALAAAIVPTYWQAVLAQCAVFTVVALSIVIVRRAVGAVSLCQASFMGMAAYACVWLLDEHGLPFALAAALAVAVPLVLSGALALTVQRLRGMQVTILTVAVAVAATAVVFQPTAPLSITPTGAAYLPPSVEPLGTWGTGTTARFIVLVLVAVAVYAAVSVLLAGPVGNVWRTLERGRPIAATSGIRFVRYEMLGFAVAGAIAGFGGVLLLVQQSSVAGDTFGLPKSISLVVFGMLLGVEHVRSAIVAGAIAGGGPQVLHTFGIHGDLVMAVAGLAVVVAIVARARPQLGTSHATA